jgi:hypothetical protein
MQRFFNASLAVLITIWIVSQNVYAQSDSIQKTIKTFRPGRFSTVMALESGAATATLIGLNEIWYKDYPKSSFHFFNDNQEWQQMDKAGHTFTAYQLSRMGYSALRWSGVKPSKAAWFGGLTGMSYQMIIEMLDGFSSEWGFSAGDFTANIGGSAIFTAQQLLWKEQRFSLKYSYHYTKYAAYHPELLGSNRAERILKDYNGQTYWLSCSPGSFIRDKKKFPPWIAVAVGYSAQGMLGAKNNDNYPELSYIDRERRFFLSADIDFSKIPVKSKCLHTIFCVLNIIKVPLPALEFNTNKGLRAHWLYL